METIILSGNKFPLKAALHSNLKSGSWEICFREVSVLKKVEEERQSNAVTLQCNLLTNLVGSKIDHGNFCSFFLPKSSIESLRIQHPEFMPILSIEKNLEISLFDVSSNGLANPNLYSDFSFLVLAIIKPRNS